jgi:creatinine amidohydrolase
MQWENLTSYDFEKYVKTSDGVGIIPIGVLEGHASHLPLGMDMFAAHWTSCRAAEAESAIVFPAYPYGINSETAHLPGGAVFDRELVFRLLENVCDEMYRNGITKIILHTGHGGNRYYLPLFVQTLPDKDKPYAVYFANIPMMPAAQEVLDAKEFGHAGEAETSMMLHMNADIVKMDQLPPPFTNARRNQKLADAHAYMQMDWFAQYPHMYVGDASKSTAEKGEHILNAQVDYLVDLIRAVKADDVTPGLIEEFSARRKKPNSPDFWMGSQE